MCFNCEVLRTVWRSVHIMSSTVLLSSELLLQKLRAQTDALEEMTLSVSDILASSITWVKFLQKNFCFLNTGLVSKNTMQHATSSHENWTNKKTDGHLRSCFRS